MAFDIFRVNWILVDAIIIIFLLILLITVKLFRYLNRWRARISDERLSRIYFKGSSIKAENLSIILKKLEFTTQISEKDKPKSKPTILIFNSKSKKKLISALAEGLSSYGLDVINLKCKILKKPKNEPIKIEIQKEIMKLINSLFDFFKQNGIHLNTNYYLLNIIQRNLAFRGLMNDIKNKKLILLNPKLNKFNRIQIHDIIRSSNLESRLSLIFSGKINRFLKKLSLNKFLSELPSHTSDNTLFVFKKISNSFKYYETILLGTLIQILEKG